MTTNNNYDDAINDDKDSNHNTTKFTIVAEEEEQAELFDIVIVGGGIVGLSILRSATLEGWNCVLVEAEPHLLSWASGSNSGIVCTGVDASPGTLERALIRDSISQIRTFCHSANVPMRECGSLVCQWPWDNEDTTTKNNKLVEVCQESHEAGDTHATKLTPNQVQTMEPNLSTECLGAVHIPGEIVVDPWLFSIAFAVQARANGARIITNFQFDAKSSHWDGNIWTAVANSSSSGDDNAATPRVKAKVLVNATGLWSDIIHNQLREKNKIKSPIVTTRQQWQAKPRRGQYRLFFASNNNNNNSRLLTHPIQPVPTQRTKGIFVFGSLYNQIIVGPTALDQESRTDRSMDPKVAQELSQHVQRILPKLDIHKDHVGDYVGIRPGTNQRDYQIQLLASQNYIAAAGIRSTGLTASLGIGAHIVRLLKCCTSLPLPLTQTTTTTTTTRPLPPIANLVKDYHHRRDGCVKIHGYIYKVTHPITIYGWNAQSGIASTGAAAADDDDSKKWNNNVLPKQNHRSRL